MLIALFYIRSLNIYKTLKTVCCKGTSLPLEHIALLVVQVGISSVNVYINRIYLFWTSELSLYTFIFYLFGSVYWRLRLQGKMSVSTWFKKKTCSEDLRKHIYISIQSFSRCFYPNRQIRGAFKILSQEPTISIAHKANKRFWIKGSIAQMLAFFSNGFKS